MYISYVCKLLISMYMLYMCMCIAYTLLECNCGSFKRDFYHGSASTIQCQKVHSFTEQKLILFPSYFNIKINLAEHQPQKTVRNPTIN